MVLFFFSSRRRHTRYWRDWSSDVCSSDLRLISSVVILFIIGFSGLGIDNYGHFGGLVAGFGLGKLFADRQPMNSSERRIAYGLGWLAGLVVLVSFALMILHFRDGLPWQQ